MALSRLKSMTARSGLERSPLCRSEYLIKDTDLDSGVVLDADDEGVRVAWHRESRKRKKSETLKQAFLKCDFAVQCDFKSGLESTFTQHRVLE